ncbi:helix-turn-helix transcriptional regulator [Branchiibius sp. NY16-3462-2]|uniref:helix-turn-helix domain-containing protein n=1 Tax=Branchiibius sp. NY16-3462-2 TaxID=1807500 RepID=UPI00079218E5|nr:helix-turn-helix transcriptional regulator [Branchiibius sp. NY16-3462-2]KYH43133.1 transcriptional regulator [Branchiibius sp. NY16-3462-2]
MDANPEASDFLRSRRDRISPSEAGIISGSNRRVPGLRREEVAFLSGVSVDYYARLERGNLAGVSTEVLDALARVLRLDDAETTHLYDLAQSAATASPARRRTAAPGAAVRPGLQTFIDSITRSAVWIRDERMDLVSCNALGRAVYAPVIEDPSSRGGNTLFTFLSPAAPAYFVDWARAADDTVATLRLHLGRNPRDKAISDLVGELTTRSDEFTRRWATHNVRHHRAGTKRIHHPSVGIIELSYEALLLPDRPNWTMFAFTPAPETPSAERLALLGSLAADVEPATADGRQPPH